MQQKILYYIHDPMCSWCWGFRPVWQQVQQTLAGRIDIRYLLGGLAPDCDQPMPISMQDAIRDTWKTIQREIPATEFNYAFWSVCKPRRSTYPSCRAVIASRMQQPLSDKAMLLAIQQAYYLYAKNPSDEEILIQLATDIGLDKDRFIRDLNSDVCREIFESERKLARDMYVSSYPALVLSQFDGDKAISINYNSSDSILEQIYQNCDQL